MQKGCAAHKPDFCLVNALKRRRTGQAAQAASTAAVVLARPTGPSKAVVPARPAAAARAAYTWVVAAGCHASSRAVMLAASPHKASSLRFHDE